MILSDLETVVHIVTIVGGTVTLVLALLQIVETYLDVGDKLRKRRQHKKHKESSSN